MVNIKTIERPPQNSSQDLPVYKYKSPTFEDLQKYQQRGRDLQSKAICSAFKKTISKIKCFILSDR